jgi:caa(3)-type oxidase subunit IV
MRTVFRHLRVLAGLFLCLALTTALSFLPLHGWNWIPCLVLALVMSGLIALFFMRVRYSEPLIWLTSVAGLVWLSLFLFIIMLDYVSRPWP